MANQNDDTTITTYGKTITLQGDQIPQGAELERLIALDKARAEDSPEAMAEARAQEDAAHIISIKRKAAGQQFASAVQGIYGKYSAESQAGLVQLEKLGYVDTRGLVTLLGLENDVTQDEISQLLNRPGTDG